MICVKMADIVYPETYRNCCQIPHWICSIAICIAFYVVSTFTLLVSIFASNFWDTVYMVGGTQDKFLVCGVFISLILLIANGFLAFGIARDWALFLLIWVILSIILWKLHLILYIASVVFLYSRKNTGKDVVMILVLLLVQILWMVLIIMVGRHWYAICEEVYAQEYGRSPHGVNRRMYTISNRSRLTSHRGQDHHGNPQYRV